jgi:hypothetical protein
MFLPGETNGVIDRLTPVVPGNDVRQITVDGQTKNTDAVTFVYDDNTFNNNTAMAINSVDYTTNTVTVPDNSPCNQGNLYVYMLDNGNERALGSLTGLNGTTQLKFSTGDPLQLNNPGATSTFKNVTGTGSLKRITWVTYFVDTNNTLIRRVYGNTSAIVGTGVQNGGVGGVVPDDNGIGVGFVQMPLAFGVTDFQLKYVLIDGTTVDDVQATTVNGTSLTAAENRQRIRIVQVFLKLRAPKIDPRTRQPIEVSLSGAFYTENLVVKDPPGGNAP